jgi:Tfp pilus assembly protein PilO
MKAVQEKTYGQKVLEQLPRNTEIYSIVRSVSASGLSRIN